MFILLIYRDSATWASLTADQRAAVARDHDAFQPSVTEIELTEAFADLPQAATVRVRDGDTSVTEAPYLDTPANLCGYYLIDCTSRDRAIELAARIPDARYAAVESPRAHLPVRHPIRRRRPRAHHAPARSSAAPPHFTHNAEGGTE